MGMGPCGVAGRYDERGSADDFSQAGNLFRLLPSDEQDRLTSNIAGAMKGIPRETQERQIAHFAKADPKYGSEVRRKLGL